MIPVSFSVYFGLYVKIQMSSLLETFNEHLKQFILEYLVGLRERERERKQTEKLLYVKTLFINTLLVCMLFKFRCLVLFSPFF
jgi:dolichol kinase